MVQAVSGAADSPLNIAALRLREAALKRRRDAPVEAGAGEPAVVSPGGGGAAGGAAADDTLEGLAAAIQAQAREALARDDIGRDSVRWVVAANAEMARLLVLHASAVREGRGPVSAEAEARIVAVVEAATGRIEKRVLDRVAVGIRQVPRAMDRRTAAWIAAGFALAAFLGAAAASAWHGGCSAAAGGGRAAAATGR